MIPPKPSVLGLKKSFGFGDRLGLATPGHLAAANKWDFAPIFAQQSVREMERTRRTPEEVLAAAQSALAQADYSKPWGADADHHKTPEDIDKTAAAGFTFYTLDPSADRDTAPRRTSCRSSTHNHPYAAQSMLWCKVRPRPE